MLRNGWSPWSGIRTYCRKYALDYYAFKESSLSGLPADRFKMEMEIFHTPVAQNALRTPKDEVRVIIPGNFQSIRERDFAEAVQLRHSTRSLFDKYINKEGYEAVDFTYDAATGMGAYLLRRS